MYTLELLFKKNYFQVYIFFLRQKSKHLDSRNPPNHPTPYKLLDAPQELYRWLLGKKCECPPPNLFIGCIFVLYTCRGKHHFMSSWGGKKTPPILLVVQARKIGGALFYIFYIVACQAHTVLCFASAQCYNLQQGGKST